MDECTALYRVGFPLIFCGHWPVSLAWINKASVVFEERVFPISNISFPHFWEPRLCEQPRAFSCFLTFSDRCFISLTSVTVHVWSAPVALNSKHGKQNKALAERHPHSQAFLVYILKSSFTCTSFLFHLSAVWLRGQADLDPTPLPSVFLLKFSQIYIGVEIVQS